MQFQVDVLFQFAEEAAASARKDGNDGEGDVGYEAGAQEALHRLAAIDMGAGPAGVDEVRQ